MGRKYDLEIKLELLSVPHKSNGDNMCYCLLSIMRTYCSTLRVILSFYLCSAVYDLVVTGSIDSNHPDLKDDPTGIFQNLALSHTFPLVSLHNKVHVSVKNCSVLMSTIDLVMQLKLLIK